MSNFDKLWERTQASPHEFSSWTSLLEVADKQEDCEKYRKAYDAFFLSFPYCYGYWKKYAELECHKCGRDRAIQVYERGVQAIPLSIDLWIAYADVAAEAFHNKPDYVKCMRDLYERAVDAAGLEFRSDSLWEHYISWESAYGNLLEARCLYDRLLATPTQLYFQNLDSFKRLVEDNSPADLFTVQELASYHCKIDHRVARAVAEGFYGGIRKEGEAEEVLAAQPEPADDDEPPIVSPSRKLKKFALTDDQEASLRQLVIDSREKVYKACYQQIMKRWYFEEKIRRPYFHVKPLEDMQLSNWAEYLSFEEAEVQKAALLEPELEGQDPDVRRVAQVTRKTACSKRVRVLYERCLVACALYEHVWIRYANYLEQTEGDLKAALAVWKRACQVHLREKPTVHFHWALFLERYPRVAAEEAGDGAPTEGAAVMTALEKRLPQSALVCARRAEFMRRAGASFLDVMLILRSGIHRLRLIARRQYRRAYSAGGQTASQAASRALALSQQAKAGSGFLSIKAARLLHCLLPAEDRVPTWKLMLNIESSKSPPKSIKKEPQSMDQDDDAEAGMDTDEDVKMAKLENGNGVKTENGATGGEEEASDDEETDDQALMEKVNMTVLNLPDVRTLTEEQRRLLSGEEAALAVIVEAIKYDSGNERLYAQWLDLVYQRRPLDVDGFVAVCDAAVNESQLSEEVKLSFSQRKLQFLEEFQTDVFKISQAYHDFMDTAKAMHNSRVASQVAAVGADEDAAAAAAAQMAIYGAHGYTDMLNQPTGVKTSATPASLTTTLPTFAPVAKGKPEANLHAMAATADSFGHQGVAGTQAHYTAGAYDPLAMAQGDSTGLPPPVPVVPLMHPPHGEGLSTNVAWQKAAAAMGQGYVGQSM